jgi:hypothetical protein
MSLTPTQLSELQTIVETLRTEFPSSDDVLWQAAIRIQKGGLGPITGTGGQPAFDAAVADIVEEAEQIATVQGRQGGLGNSVDQAVFNVVPIEGELAAGSVGDILYLDTAPNTYLATSVVEVTPAGPNSVILSEVGTQVARTVPAASGGLEVNNLDTGGGFERVLTTSDLGGGITVEDEGTPLPTLATTLDFVGAGVTASGAGATKTITIPGYTGADVVAGSADGDMLEWDNTGTQYDVSANVRAISSGIELAADGVTEDARIGFYNSTFATQIARIEAFNTQALEIAAEIDGFGVQLTGLDGGSVKRAMIVCDPDNRVILHHQGTQTARTATIGVGGFEVDNQVTGGGFERVLTTSDIPPLIAGTVDDQAARWDAGNAQWEGAAQFAISDGVTGLENSTYLSKRVNGAKYEIVGDISTRLTDKRGFFGFEATTLRMFVKNTTNSSDVAISARDNVSGGTDRVLGIFNPTSDTAIFGQVSGVRISSRTSSPVRLMVNNSDRVTVDDQGLNVIGNGVQSGVIDFTEGPGGFSVVAGEGQLFVRDDDPNVLVYRDDTNQDFVLNGGGSGGGTLTTRYRFSTTTAMADPGTGRFRYNNATQSLVTQIAVSDTDRDGVDMSNILSIISSGDRLYIQEGADAANWGVYDVNGAPTDNTTWWQIPVTNVAAGDLPANNRDCAIVLLIGGASGAGIGGSITDNQIAVGAATANDIEGDANFTWDGTEQRMVGLIRMQERAASLADVATYSQLWVRNTSDGELILTDDQGLDQNLSESLYSNGAEQARATLLGLDVRDTLKVGSIGSTTGVVKLGDQANADIDEAGYGQLWVRDDTFSNTLMFTNDNGNDFEVAGIPLGGDVLDGTLVLSTTTFAGVVNIGPKPDSFYMLYYAGAVAAPAADDVKIQLTVDTNSLFVGTLTDGNGTVTELRSNIGTVVTNTVVIPTDGSTLPSGGISFTIQGHLHTGVTTQTVSLRAAKNADTGADGGIYFPACAVVPMYEA